MGWERRRDKRTVKRTVIEKMRGEVGSTSTATPTGVAALEVETESLLSQEQKIKKIQAEDHFTVSKTKMYSLVTTILILFGLLLTSHVRDWATYHQLETEEREVVQLNTMVEKEVDPGPVNVDLALELEERKALEMELEAKILMEKAKELRGRDDSDDNNDDKTSAAGDDTASADANASREEAGGRKEKVKKAKVPKPKKPKKPKEPKEKVAKKPKKELTDAEKEADKKRLARGGTHPKGRGPEYIEKVRETARYKIKRHEQKMVPRDFVLPAAKQKIVDEYDGSLKPPEYCYKSPKGNKAEPREPDHDDKRNADLPLDIAKKILRLAAADYPCLILHQECMRNETSQHADKFFHEYDRLYFQKSTLTREQKITKVPNFANLKLGTCAIVGNADNMLHHKHGKEIDEHDFVVRFNVITKPYKDGVGSKCSGLFIKPNYATSKFKRDLDPSMFNFFPKYVPFELKPATLPGGKPPLVYGQYDNGLWRTDLEQMFWGFIEEKNLTDAGYSFGVKKLPHPTGGLSRLRSMIQLLSMGVCDRLDVYGFSVGGGKYFDPKKIVSHAHPISSENYFYRLYMATGVHGKFCLYGK